MGRMSDLSDELLIKILSFHSTKEAVSTSILSKQWKFLWMWLPKLEYISPNPRLRLFIYKTLPSHKAPVIESLRLDISSSGNIGHEDISQWIDVAVSRHLRELEISYFGLENIFPSSLFTCNSLMTLKLTGIIPIGDSSLACFPSLKTLQLVYVTFVDGIEGASLQKLLSVCPLLEDLSVHCALNRMKEFSIIVPSLQSLSLYVHNYLSLNGYVIDTPSLKYLKLEDWSYGEHYSLIKNMPQLSEAYVSVGYSNLNSVIESITSVKRLTICSEGVYDDGFVFNQLEHLTLCACKKDSSKLRVKLFENSSNLRVFGITLVGDHKFDCIDSWNQLEILA